MKRYDELTPEQRAQADENALTELLHEVVEGAIQFNDKRNGDNLQARIDKAWRKAEAMQ